MEDKTQMEKYKLCLDNLNEKLVMMSEFHMTNYYKMCLDALNEEVLRDQISMINFYKMCRDELKGYIDASEIDMSEDDWLIKCMGSFKEKMWSKYEIKRLLSFKTMLSKYETKRLLSFKKMLWSKIENMNENTNE